MENGRPALATKRLVPEPIVVPKEPVPAEPPPAPQPDEAVDFLQAFADPDASVATARDEHGEVSVAFLSDGRVRLTDAENRRFAGMLQDDKADLLEIGTGTWSTVYLRRSPDGTTQLELHGGPYDARVLTCEPAPR